MSRTILLWLIVICFIHKSETYSKKLLLISMDGFRWDYLNMVETPNFDRIAREGVKAPSGLMNTFITKTFPCHYTLATGLYEETHGIIGNHMYDPVLNKSFSFGTTDTEWWDGGEPIWITATLQGLKTATYFWPGSETKLRGVRPDIWMPYLEKVPFKIRVDAVVSWFKNLDVDFATLYFHEPDHTGHEFGPLSQQIKDKVKYMDGMAGYILEQLENAKLLDLVNVIFTSDHGMAEIDTENMTIDLLDYASGDLFDLIDAGSMANIRPKPGKTDELYNKLHGKHPNMTVYLKDAIPDHFHYKNNRRVMDIFIIPDEGWTITKNRSKLRVEHGNHGYDNKYPSMHPIFLARGPDFKKDHTVDMFETVNIYPLICELLGIQPAPNNGSFENVKDLVKSGGEPIRGQLHFVVLFICLVHLVY